MLLKEESDSTTVRKGGGGEGGVSDLHLEVEGCPSWGRLKIGRRWLKEVFLFRRARTLRRPWSRGGLPVRRVPPFPREDPLLSEKCGKGAWKKVFFKGELRKGQGNLETEGPL